MRALPKVGKFARIALGLFKGTPRGALFYYLIYTPIMYIKVKVTPKAKQDEIKATGPSRFEIKTKMPAERDLANEAVLTLLATYLKLPRSYLRIISGHHERSKLISVKD